MPDIPRKIQVCVGCGSRDSFRIEWGDPIITQCMTPGCGAKTEHCLEGVLIPRLRMPDA